MVPNRIISQIYFFCDVTRFVQRCSNLHDFSQWQQHVSVFNSLDFFPTHRYFVTLHSPEWPGEGSNNKKLITVVERKLRLFKTNFRKDIRMKNSSRFSMWFHRPVRIKYSNNWLTNVLKFQTVSVWLIKKTVSASSIDTNLWSPLFTISRSVLIQILNLVFFIFSLTLLRMHFYFVHPKYRADLPA